MSCRPTRLLTVVAAGAAACILAAPAAGAATGGSGPNGNSTNAQKCQKGGYANYVDPATGKPFATQDACVSYAAHGGTLTKRTLTIIGFDGFTTSLCQPILSGAGFAPDTSYGATDSNNGSVAATASGIVSDSSGTITNSDVTGLFGSPGQTYTVTVDGVTSAPVTVQCDHMY